MSLCKSCWKSPLPYLVIGLVTSVLTFVTYLSTHVMGLADENRMAITLTTLIFSLAITFSYISRCVNRHCGHEHHQH